MPNWTRKALVSRAINFSGASRIPLWTIGGGIDSSDVYTYDFSLPDPEDSQKSEWGFERKKSPDGLWVVPDEPYLSTWKEVDAYRLPEQDLARRVSGLPQAAQVCADRYRLCSLGLTGFSIYHALRGTEFSAVDCLIEPYRFVELMEKIFDFERGFIDLIARQGFHGIEFTDDWMDRQFSRITLSLWQKLLKDRYAAVFRWARAVGLHVWMSLSVHCAEFIPDLQEIGVDVIRIDSPRQMKVASIARESRGKVAFAVRLDEMLHGTNLPVEELKELIACLGKGGNGFIAALSERANSRAREKALALLTKISE